ncbi:MULTISPECIES: DUF1801 domain-containing protein [Rhodococcus erythropolis group]|nr:MULTISPECIES: DUF1801 domain-containing protein [Rhodococcus erythropolis group]
MERVSEDVDEFLRRATRTNDLVRLDEIIQEALPGEERALWRGRMWGGTEQAIVGYRSISQPRPRGDDVEWFLVGLAEQKRHLSVYVNAVEEGVYLVQSRTSRLGRVKVGAAAVTFRSVTDLHLPEFRSLLIRAGQLNTRTR